MSISTLLGIVHLILEGPLTTSISTHVRHVTIQETRYNYYQGYGGGDWYQSPMYPDPNALPQYRSSRQAWNSHPQVVCPQGYGGGDWYHSPVYPDPNVQRQYHGSGHPRAEYHRSDEVNLGGEELSSSTRPVVRRLFVHKPDAVHVNRTVQSTGPTQGLASLPRGVPPSKGSTQISPVDLSVKQAGESRKQPGPRKRQRPKSISPGTQPEPKRPELRVPSVPKPPAPSRSDSPTQPRQFTLTASLSTVSIPSISRTDLDLEYLDDGACDILGEGGYGYVQRGRLEQDEMATNIAAKFFKPNRASVEEIEREAKIQRYLQDTGAVPKVHGLINMASKGGDPILVQECVGQGTTVEDLMARGADRKTWLQFTLQAAQGLQKIHQKGVLLNDIKFDNILLDESLESLKVKFVDMGMATFNSSYTSTVKPADMVDCHHIAPEVVNQAPSSVKSDLYSLGYVLRVIGEDAHLPDLEMLGSLLMRDNPAQRLSLPVFIKCVEFFMNSCN
ncbi:uncharacterized protein LOC135473398 [Liolophura sinensis]|uniref:uncharacterized protein LOC135473398 n=1 Tax=Liolophura sinensis TaxID=3198878 RepID=UPI003158F76C